MTPSPSIQVTTHTIVESFGNKTLETQFNAFGKYISFFTKTKMILGESLKVILSVSASDAKKWQLDEDDDFFVQK